MADKKSNPPRIILLYGVIINEAIASADKDVMKAVAKVSKFMMNRVSKEDAGSDHVRDWHAAHEDLMKALG